MRAITFALLALAAITPTAASPDAAPLRNTFDRLSRGEPVRIVVVGNSVTAGAPAGQSAVPSFYVAMEAWFRKTFPDSRIKVVPRIIYAIGPEVQLFYQDARLLSESPDLVLAEFGAANGAWGRAGTAVTEPATEGYVRRLRKLSPRTNVILMMGVFETMLDDYRANRAPPSAEFLHRVATHYDCLAVYAGAELARRVVAGEPWETYMKDFIHPSPAGYTLYSETLVAALEREWQRFRSAPVPSSSLAEPRTAPIRTVPETTLHPTPWSDPRLVPASDVTTSHGFEPRVNGSVAYLESTRTDATGRYTAPAGRRVLGVLMRESKPSGNLEVRIPGGDWVLLTQSRTPHFTVKEDPANRLYRNFFASESALPPDVTDIEFRLSPNPETGEARLVQIVGFFEVASFP